MPTLSSVLITAGMILSTILVGALCLKIVVWLCNAVLFGKDAGTGVPPPSFVKCALINAIVFGIMFGVCNAGQSGLVAAIGTEALRYSPALEWVEVAIGWALMAGLLIKILPTTAWRAVLISSIDLVVLFFMAALFLMGAMMLANSNHTSYKQ